MTLSKPILTRLILLFLVALVPAGRAQWLTQTNQLRAGWNAVYLHVDPLHTDINGLVDALDPIEEIWLWNAVLPPSQIVATPQLPAGSQWSVWTRNDGPASMLQFLRGNSALLVRVTDTVPSFAWKVQGRPAAPLYRWTLSGLNFIGFPTALPSPTFDSFLAPDAQALDWGQSAEIFRYQGGILGATNPVWVAPLIYRNTLLRRDQAYWVRTGELTNQFFNQYFGPFRIRGSDLEGIQFGEIAGQTRMYLQNMTTSNLVVTLQQVPSETPPVGQGAVAGVLPLLLRGPLSPTNLTFGSTPLTMGSHQWNLAPKGEVGSEVEVILGLDRTQMTAAPGSEYAGVLRFTDSLGLSQVDLAASATTPSRAGLWVGSAVVDYVSQYLKPYAQATNEVDFAALLSRLGLVQGANGYRYEWDPPTGRVLVFGGTESRTGSYLLDGPIQLDNGRVAVPFPLRLIVHNDGATARLLQRAYIGLGSQSNLVVATREAALLPSAMDSARRVSAVHLPTSDANLPWTFAGLMEPGSTLTTIVTLAHDDHASNPMLHTYHPDHDNVDALFAAPLGQGIESFGARRVVSLQITAPPDDFDSLTRGGGNLTGNYSETVTFLDRHGDAKAFSVLGTFQLSRIVDIATLTTTP